jgi:hypothetical protein
MNRLQQLHDAGIDLAALTAQSHVRTGRATDAKQ